MIVACVTPAGTTKLWLVPVWSKVTLWTHAPALLHAHVCPAEQLVGQSMHAAPELPHATFVVPPRHTPLVADEQHPPLHGIAFEQAIVHWWFPAHAVADEQSPATLQPHVLPPRHACPVVEPVQSVHAPPVSPHALGAVPATQKPDEQQPPLHG